MARTKVAATPRANLSIQTLRICHEALQMVAKPNAQVTFNCAQAMQELEAILAALPQDVPAPAPAAEEPAAKPQPKKATSKRP